jgi:hypothetical protein
MSTLRSVGGWGEVDLDQRAITTEDDIVDLSELERSDDQHNEPAPAIQNRAAGHDEPGEAETPPAASSPNLTAARGETPPASDVLGQESDKDFDSWVAHRASPLGTAPSTPTPGTARLASDVQGLPSGGAPRIASATAGVPRDESTALAATNSNRLRRNGPLSLPLGRLARPVAAMAALTLTAGGTAFAINAATTSTPHARPQISTSHAALFVGPSNWTGDALSTTIAAVTSEFHALARAVPPAHRASHPPHKPRRHHASRHTRVPVQRHARVVSEQSNAAQAPPASTPTPQTQSYTPPATSAASSTSHTSTGSQTSSSQPAGPTRSSPLGGIGSCVSGCT